MSETTKKTTPIVDVWMFLWRVFFAPLVIAVSFIWPIFMCCFALLLFVLSEVVSFLVAFVVSVCGPRWVIKKWATTIYGWVRDSGFKDWSVEEIFNVPTKWWKLVTDPPVRKGLSQCAAVMSAIVLSLFIIGLSFHGQAVDGAATNAIHFWLFGPILLWAILLWVGLWLVKKGLELLMRWIFQRSRPKPTV